MSCPEECFDEGCDEPKGCPNSCEDEDDDKEATQMTCDVLCALSSTAASKKCASASVKSEDSDEYGYECKGNSSKSCPNKQFQLPMFLSSKWILSIPMATSLVISPRNSIDC
jgi:hypothetical protein